MNPPSSSSSATELQRLVDIVARLRGPDGCSWDRQQTVDTLKPFVIEEAYEVVEAIDRHDHAALCDELGDYLFEAMLLAQVESDGGHFTIADAARCAADKLVRRHPHVFAREPGQPTLDPASVRAQWETIKAQERAERGEARALLAGIPTALPALLRAYRLGARAASVGFDWTRALDVVTKLREEVDEIARALEADPVDRSQLEDEIGDLLFAVANLARKLDVEPESALRRGNAKFTARFTALESRVHEGGRRLHELSLDELEEEWRQVKAAEQPA